MGRTGRLLSGLKSCTIPPLDRISERCNATNLCFRLVNQGVIAKVEGGGDSPPR